MKLSWLLVPLLLTTTVAVATPAQCADPCVVPSAFPGYVPPVVEIASGNRVVWTTLDVTHVQVDPGNCFVASASRSGPSAAIRFEAADGALFATGPGPDGAPRTLECTRAVPMPEGGFLLPYFCRLHPNMQAAILVSS